MVQFVSARALCQACITAASPLLLTPPLPRCASLLHPDLKDFCPPPQGLEHYGDQRVLLQQDERFHVKVLGQCGNPPRPRWHVCLNLQASAAHAGPQTEVSLSLSLSLALSLSLSLSLYPEPFAFGPRFPACLYSALLDGAVNAKPK